MKAANQILHSDIKIECSNVLTMPKCYLLSCSSLSFELRHSNQKFLQDVKKCCPGIGSSKDF